MCVHGWLCCEPGWQVQFFDGPQWSITTDGRAEGIAECVQLSPEDVVGLQMHGTGTSLGDPVEVGALSAVLLGATKSQNPLALSAVKSCVGHSEAAAGLSGILQLFGPLLMGSHSPLLHLRDVNPLVANVLDTQAEKGGKVVQLPRYSSAQCADVASDVQGVYGVSGFAFQGTNAHALLSPPSGSSLVSMNHQDRKPVSTWDGVRCWIVSHKRSLLVEEFVVSSGSASTVLVETCLSGHPLLSGLHEYDVCGRQVLCASAFVRMAAKTMEMLQSGKKSPCLVHALFTSTLVLATKMGENSPVVIQCEVTLSSGDAVIMSRGQNSSSAHMSCSTQDVDDSAAHVLAFSEGKKGDNVLSQSVSAGQGTILTPHQLAFEDESAMQGFGDLESSLHLMDTVTSSDLVDFELQARIPGSLGACLFAGIRSWFNFACHGHRK